MIIVPLSQESTKTKPVNVEVDASPGEGSLTLVVPPDLEHPHIPWRVVLPEEARAIAAALLHFAAEADR